MLAIIQSVAGAFAAALILPVMKRLDLLRIIWCHAMRTGATMMESVAFAKALDRWNKRWSIFMRGG